MRDIRSSSVITAGAGVDSLLPLTTVNDPLLFMVDLDAGTIRVKGPDDTVSHLLYGGIDFPDEGMRPGLSVRYNSRADVNFAGPFDLVPDPGYLPRGSLADPADVPTVSLTIPADKSSILYSNLPLAPFTAMANDREDGDLSDNVSFISSVDGPFTTASELSPGIHQIHALVADSDGNIGGSAPHTVMIDADQDIVIYNAYVNPTGITFLGDAHNLALVNGVSPASWNAFYGQKARNTGKFAFAYKHIVGGSNTSRLGIGAAYRYLGAPGAAASSYAFGNHGRKFASGTETAVTGAPLTDPGESLLFMVDLDAGTIRVRGTGDTASKEIFNALNFR